MSVDFLEKLLLAAVGPLVGAVFGTLIIGTFAAWLTRRAQDHRAEKQLRYQLIGEMTEVASELYMETQNFWRKKDVEKVVDAKLDEHRKVLDQQYRSSRVKGEVIERKLGTYFSSGEPRALWHAVMDLLTVRYFSLVGLATDRLLQINSGAEHSGLSPSELQKPELLLNAYREKLRQGAEKVLTASMKPLA